MTHSISFTKLALFALAWLHLSTGAAATRADQIRQKFDDPSAGIFIAAHRGCHNASPRLALDAVPENSRPALEHCVLLGVDMMELDVRRAGDGTLVVIHDATVDRTTDGHGAVAAMTLPQLKRLRLRQNFGGRMSPELSDERVQTLAEMLEAAKGRIMLNLDIKDENDIYAQVVAEARAHGMARHVLVKSFVDERTPDIVADRAMFAGVPYMPIVGPWSGGAQAQSPARILARQLQARHKPAGVELVYLPENDYEAVRKLVGEAGIRLWANSLTSVGVISVIGRGGDLEGLRTSGKAWGDLIRSGVDTLQTDEPGPLLDYLEREHIRH